MIYRTVSTDALNVLSGCLPLDLVISKEIDYVNYINNLEINYTGINLNTLNNDYYNNAVRVYFNTKHDKDIGHHIELYTDGSKVNNNVGAGVVVYNNQVEVTSFTYRLNSDATVFMAELYAIDRAVAYIINDIYDRGDSSTKYVVISDSMSVLLALSSPNENRTYILNLKNKLNYMHIDLYWTKAHIGAVGNERADELAKMGTNRPIIDIIFAPTKTQVKNLLLDKYYITWNNRWNDSFKGRTTFLYIQEVNCNRLISDFYLNQIVTGHGIFPAFQAERFRKDDSCICMEARGTVEHVAMECYIGDHIRKKYFDPDFSSKSVLELLNHRKSTIGLRLIVQLYYDLVMSPSGIFSS